MVFSWANFTSVSGNEGCWATSLIRANSFVENSESDEADIVVESASLPRERVPPIERSSSFSCLLVSVSVPSLATPAAICAIPGCACRSAAVVAERNVRIDEIFGTFGNGASTTVRPFASFFSVIFGRFNGLAAPGGGGVFCCASAGVSPRVSERVRVIIASAIFILVGAFLLWDAIDHGAICRHEILRSSRFDLRRGDVFKRRQQRVDLLRVVAEERECRE